MEKHNIPENISISTETLDSNGLEKIVYEDDHRTIKENRFNSIENGGVFKYFEPKYIREGSNFPIVKEDKIITGIAVLNKSPFKEKVFWVMSIDVDPKYQGQHHSTKLVEEVVKFTKDQGYSLELSGYTNKDAKDKLDRLFKEFAKKYGVALIDNK
jgi:GNAT superfamily N-acetyltransferase